MTETLYVYLLGGMFALIFSNIAVWLYVAFFKLSQVEKHLSNCQLVENNRRIWGGRALRKNVSINADQQHAAVSQADRQKWRGRS